MLSRRDFLKISGLTTVAAATGFGAGKLLGNTSLNSFRVQAYIPDAQSASDLTKIIRGNAGKLIVSGETGWENFISEAFYHEKNNGIGKMIVKIERINHTVPGDILFSDSKTIIYNPENDFNGRLIQLRSDLKNKNSNYRYTAYFNNETLLNSLLKSGENIVIIENENGIYDQVKLSGSAKELFINGPSGKTGITIKDNSVHIHSSCCRNGLCRESVAIINSGDMIACAPNKVIVRIEKV
jgi:hypothetical protein